MTRLLRPTCYLVELGSHLPGILFCTSPLLCPVTDFDGRDKDAIKSKHDAMDFLAARQESKPASLVAALANDEKDNDANESGKEKKTEEKNTDTAGASTKTESGAKAEMTMTELGEEDKLHWRQRMRKTLNSHVRFVTDARAAADLEIASERGSHWIGAHSLGLEKVW